MERIMEINDSDVGLDTHEDAKSVPKTSARVVLRNGDKIALLRAGSHDYYKLPGGFVHEGETITDGLKRGILREVGSTFRIVNEIGEIIEQRSQIELVQTTHCYLAEVETEGIPSFTEEEIEGGFELVWVTFSEAIDLLKKSKPKDYDGKFIVVRDVRFLEESKKFFK